MATIQIPGLECRPNKTGPARWYWQPTKALRAAGWKALAFGKDEAKAIAGARVRNQEIAAWQAGGSAPEGVARQDQAGTLGELVTRYRREVIAGTKPGTNRPRLAAKTIANYQTSLARIEAWAGARPLAWVNPLRVGAWRDQLLKDIGHAPAFATLKSLRALFSFAEDVHLIAKGANPATEFGLEAPPPRAAVWEDADEAAFREVAWRLGMPSMALALDLALYTAQRMGDLVAMHEGQWGPLAIATEARALFAGNDNRVMGWSFIQEKTGVPMAIPFERGLLARVETALAENRARASQASPAPIFASVLIDDRTGQPWTKHGFADAWRLVLDHAADVTGRPHMCALVWHDLRRTRVVRLRRAGMEVAKIAAMTGHHPASINKMLEVYGPIDPIITATAFAEAVVHTINHAGNQA